MAKFPAKLGAQVGVGQIYYKEGLLKKKTTSFKKSWHEYILPRRVRCHLSAWIWCWWARQDSLGCMKFTEYAPKLSRGVSGKILQGRKVIQTTEFLKQTVNASDTRILNDLMYLIGTPHMFVCVGVDLMCHRYYIRYSNKFWHVSPKILGRMFGYFWMTGSFLMFFIYMSIISISQSATSGFELWSSRQIPRCLRVLLQVVWKRTSWAEMMWMRYSKIIFVYTLLIDIFDWTL